MHGQSKQRCPAAAADIDISIYFMHSNLNSSILCISSWHCLTSFGTYSHNNGNIIEHLGISIRSARKGEHARELTLFHLNYNAIFRPGGPTTTINKNNSSNYSNNSNTDNNNTDKEDKKPRGAWHAMHCCFVGRPATRCGKGRQVWKWQFSYGDSRYHFWGLRAGNCMIFIIKNGELTF